MELPRRLAEDLSRSERLATDMKSANDERVLTDSMTINFWTDPDGRQHIEVTSDREMTPLQAKGLLHDALYSLVHTEEIKVH